MPEAVIDPAALGLAGVAILALLLLMAAEALGRVLALGFSYIPVVGGSISKAIEGAVITAVAVLNPQLQGSITPLIDFVAWPFVHLGPTVEGIISNLENAGGAIGYLGTTMLSRVATGANAFAMGAVGGLAVTVTGWLAAVEVEYKGLFATAEADITAAEGSALAYAGQVGQDVLNTAQAGIAAAETLAAAAVAQLAGVVASNEQALEQLVTGGLADSESKLNAVIADAKADATTALDGLRAWVQQQEGALQAGHTGALGLGLAGVITQVTQVAEELTQYRQTCGDPLCNNLGQYGQELSMLSGALSSGFLIALLVGAATDPKGLAAQLSGEFYALAQGIQAGVKDLAGLVS